MPFLISCKHNLENLGAFLRIKLLRKTGDPTYVSSSIEKSTQQYFERILTYNSLPGLIIQNTLFNRNMLIALGSTLVLQYFRVNLN